MDRRNARYLSNLCHLKDIHTKLEMEVAEHHDLINHLQSKLNSIQKEREALLNCYWKEFQDVKYHLEVEQESTKNLSRRKEAFEKDLRDVIDDAYIEHRRSASKAAFLKEEYDLLKKKHERKGGLWKWVDLSVGVGIISVVATVAFVARRR